MDGVASRGVTVDTFRGIPLAELLENGAPLFEKARVATRLPPVDINVPLFQALADAGILHVVGMFTPEGQLVGYAACTVGQHPLHGDRNCCTCVSIFVEEGHRQFSGSVELLKRVEELGKAVGANMMLWTVRCGSPLETVLSRRGAVQVDSVFVKDL